MGAYMYGVCPCVYCVRATVWCGVSIQACVQSGPAIIEFFYRSCVL